METTSSEHIILFIVVIIQVLVAAWTILEGLKIQSVFSSDLDNYILGAYAISNENGTDTERPVINVIKSNKELDLIIKRINSYLISNYDKKKSPDISPLESLIKNQSKVNDSRASLFASFPILIGLAGTIIGLLYAFTQIDEQNALISSGIDNTESVNFLSLISKSSSIVFWGSFCGIILSIILNYLIATFKLQRDIRANHLIFFLNSKVGPALPTVREETISLIASQLELFSDAYFERFRAYANEFEKLTLSIQNLYEVGFKNIIERNTEIMQKFIQTIDKLDELNNTSKAIRFKPETYREFIYYSQELINSNINYAQKLDEYGAYFISLNRSFRDLQERVDKGVIDLTIDKQLITDFHLAMKNFMTSTRERTTQMSKSAEDFDKILGEIRDVYKHSLDEIKDGIADKIEKTINPEEYKLLIEKLSVVSSSLEIESGNIKMLSESLILLNEKLSTDLTPSLGKVTGMLDKLNLTVSRLDTTVVQTIPKTLSETIKTNKRMVLETSEELLKEPRSWGQWSFLGIQKLLKKEKNRDGAGE